MARNRGEPPKNGPKRPDVVRRAPEDRKRLPADLEAFAGGDDDALWRRPAKRRLNDPRPVVLVPGVANRDARAVYEAREKRLREVIERGDRDALAIELAEAMRLGVWRGHSIVGADVFLEDVLGLSPDESAALIARGAEQIGGAELASEDVVATWMRAEAGLLEASRSGVVRMRGAPGEERLIAEIPLEDAAPAFAAIGRRAAPLAREQSQAPRSVVDRPRGVPRLSTVIDRDNEDE